MKVLTAAEMRDVDRLTAERYSIPLFTLMQNAGTRVADFLSSRFPNLSNRPVLVLCGKGNNGGDGLVVASQLLQKGVKPNVILFAAPQELRGDAAISLEQYRAEGGEIEIVRTSAEWRRARGGIESAQIIVDALLGTGLRGVVEGLLADVIEDVNKHDAATRVVAVDIPSGLSSDTGEILGVAIHADSTVTFTAPKMGLLLAPGANLVGKLIVADIGSPRELIEQVSSSKVRWLEPSEFTALQFRRPYTLNTNKGSYGHVLVLAGSRGKTGAATMVGWAALRSGAGLVTVASAETALDAIGTNVPEMMKEPLAATSAGTIGVGAIKSGQFAELEKGKNVLAVGPGLTTNNETQDVVRAVVSQTPLNLVLDADGLNAFAGASDTLKRHAAPSMVLTPHPGEMARLLGCSVIAVQKDRIKGASRAAANWNAHVVLKGHETVIAAPDGKVWVNSTGNPGMGTAGTGDVLTGMLAGLAAQFGKDHWDTCICLGVYLHGLAGDLAAGKVGEIPLIATDVIHSIPSAFAQTISEIERARG